MINRYKTIKQQRKVRVRGKVTRQSNRPRLVVLRSNKHIYAQIIDLSGKTVVTSSDKSITLPKTATTKTQRAELVGADIATKAKKAKIVQVAFDRGYYKYHGRVKALADAARSIGLEF